MQAIAEREIDDAANHGLGQFSVPVSQCFVLLLCGVSTVRCTGDSSLRLKNGSARNDAFTTFALVSIQHFLLLHRVLQIEGVRYDLIAGLDAGNDFLLVAGQHVSGD